ncbi:MAG TPA: 1-deoxy-D-xylulose-5-phosphate reductoisomerase [Phycisphaerales bacterium]|nr:1-deoxy-D-xylulose-5-phosphate reductoisomerase [Phycisphaerales bacterium]
MNDTSAPLSRRLIVLGSTGSIGVNTLAVVEHLRAVGFANFEVVGLAAGNNAELLAAQAARFNVKNIAVASESAAAALKSIPHLYVGQDAALELVQNIAMPGDLVVGAMVGSAGVPATMAAIERGCDIALANKETLVAAGALVMPLVRKKGINLLPVDSEHSALFQCLENVQTSGRCVQDEVARIIITASGGPFRTWERERIENATVEQALNHPTWTMGRKVTIDSASLMNKALEVIEAHWLFDMPASKIDAIVHPQSIIHSFVEFIDGSILSQLGAPDMRTPIQYALTWPRRAVGKGNFLDWAALSKMDFEPVDHDRFGALKLAYQVIETGGTAGAIFNAANEAAVEAFLAKQIPFGRITSLVGDALHRLDPTPVRTLEDVFEADQQARRLVRESVSRAARPAAV